MSNPKRRKERPLVIGEHRSPRRRRSSRRYNTRNAPKVRARALRWYRQNREYALARKRSHRLKQHSASVWGCRQVTEAEWSDIKRHYQSIRAMGNAVTFRQLAARFMVSPRRIQRRSSKDGGWALRTTTA
jgi:hypothetical protein